MAGASSRLRLLCHLRRFCSSPSLAIPGLPLSSPGLLPPAASVSNSLPCAQTPLPFSRFFSASSSEENSELLRGDLCDRTNSGHSEVVDGVLSRVADEGSILPVNALMSLLDHYHDLSGLPWWVVIASSTLAMRITLVPVLVLQLRKVKRIAELTPKLPPPLPPPFSGRSYMDHILLFRRERRASGCPSLLWMLLSFSVQIPCFLLWVVTIRRMSLDNHPGFDCGGVLWFHNMAEIPHSALGSIFPLLIGLLHYTNVQAYKKYLDLITLPIICIAFCIPQGSLVYWATNASLSVIQQIALNHPAVRLKLGLPKEDIILGSNQNSDKLVNSDITSLGLDRKQKGISEQDLSPKELLALSVQVISKGDRDEGISLLRLALEKDPDYIRAMIALGQTLLQKEEPEEAAEYLEGAISKLFRASYLTEAEYLYLLMVASQWAGIAYIQQSKHTEGILHLERIALLKEPQEPTGKADYYEGLVLLASALFKQGRRAEATKYLRLAAAYDSRYNELLEQCEKENQNFVGDLISSRRGDY